LISGIGSLRKRSRGSRLLGFLGGWLLSRGSFDAAAALAHDTRSLFATKEVAEEVEDWPFASRLAGGLASGFAGLFTSRLLTCGLALAAVEAVMETAQRATNRFFAGRFAGRLACLLTSGFTSLCLFAGVATRLAAGRAGGTKHFANKVSHRLRAASDAFRGTGRFGHSALGRFAGLAGRHVPVGREQIPQAGKQITTFCPFAGLTCRGWLGASLTALVEADHAAEHVGSPASAAQHRADHKRSQ
jgi:hypothetical protein